VKRTITIAVAFALTLGFSSAVKAQPSAADSVYLTIENNEDSAGVQDGNFVVNIWLSLNTGPMTGATLGITWDRYFVASDSLIPHSTSDWQYDSLVYQGVFAAPPWMAPPPVESIADSLGALTVGGLVFGAGGMPTGSNQLMAKLYLSLAPVNSWGAGSQVKIDSSYVPPASDFLITLTAGRSIVPTFVGAKVVTYNDIKISDENGTLPTSFELSQNFPNPFNPSTKINYTLTRKSLVNLEVYNVLGQKVRTLVSDVRDAGVWEVTWDGDTDNGAQVASGMYFYKLTAGDFVQTRKMILMK